MDFITFYIFRNKNECPLQVSCLRKLVCDSATCVCDQSSDIDELRQHLLCVLGAVANIDDAVDRWPTRLRACVRANGGHFEHTL